MNYNELKYMKKTAGILNQLLDQEDYQNNCKDITNCITLLEKIMNHTPTVYDYNESLDILDYEKVLSQEEKNIISLVPNDTINHF